MPIKALFIPVPIRGRKRRRRVRVVEVGNGKLLRVVNVVGRPRWRAAWEGVCLNHG